MFNEFYDAFKYLEEHIIFNHAIKENSFVGEPLKVSHFYECLDIAVVKVNPETMAIDENEKLNTKVQVWLEVGPYTEVEFWGKEDSFIKKSRTHDTDLDCGADTFEEAIIELANLVQKKYGDVPEKSLKIVKKQYGIK